MAKIAIVYYGQGDSWEDRVYGTGLEFDKNVPVLLPERTANIFLKHHDAFKRYEPPKPVGEENTESDNGNQDGGQVNPEDVNTVTELDLANRDEEERLDRENKRIEYQTILSGMSKDELFVEAERVGFVITDKRVGKDALAEELLQYHDARGGE